MAVIMITEAAATMTPQQPVTPAAPSSKALGKRRRPPSPAAETPPTKRPPAAAADTCEVCEPDAATAAARPAATEEAKVHSLLRAMHFLR